MQAHRFAVIVALAAVVATATASAAELAMKPHPLCQQGSSICKIIRTGKTADDSRFIKPNARRWQDWLPAGAASSDFILLGEVHDNPIHHRSRGGMLTALSWKRRTNLPPVTVFEHIRADQQPKLDAFISRLSRQNSRDRRRFAVRALMRELDWEKSGWPSSRIFAPLFQRALTGGYELKAGNPPRQTVRSVAQTGLSVLPAAEQQRLDLAGRPSGGLWTALLGELKSSHCNLLPDASLPNMAEAQAYRDAHMAAEMLKAHLAGKKVALLAGNGHIRKDRGVPHFLRQKVPDARIVTVMYVEVEDRKTKPSDYVPLDPEGKPATDYVYLTRRMERQDPCQKMRASKRRAP